MGEMGVWVEKSNHLSAVEVDDIPALLHSILELVTDTLLG